MKKETAAGYVIAILLALIVKAALETTFKPIFAKDQPWSNLLSLNGAQLGVLFIMVLRFYIGSFRIGQMEPKKLAFSIRAINFVFAFLVFSAFYTIALSVTDAGYFYTLMVVLHSVDAVWFALGLTLMRFNPLPDDQLEPGEIRLSARRKIMRIFFVLSVTTIAYAFISYRLFGIALSDPMATTAHWCFLIVLFLLSVIDFLWLKDFYFDYEEWQKKNSIRSKRNKPSS